MQPAAQLACDYATSCFFPFVPQVCGRREAEQRAHLAEQDADVPRGLKPAASKALAIAGYKNRGGRAPAPRLHLAQGTAWTAVQGSTLWV